MYAHMTPTHTTYDTHTHIHTYMQASMHTYISFECKVFHSPLARALARALSLRMHTHTLYMQPDNSYSYANPNSPYTLCYPMSLVLL